LVCRLTGLAFATKDRAILLTCHASCSLLPLSLCSNPRRRPAKIGNSSSSSTAIGFSSTAGAGATIFSRNGADFSRRFPDIAAAVVGLPTRSCVIDGELIAAGRHGQPDFLALLHGRHVPTCFYRFDLLELNGRDLREQPLVQRRARLQALLVRADSKLIRYSEAFPDAGVLLAECKRLGLESIVAKRKDSPYRSGTRSGWIKVKTPEWEATNRYRAKHFEKPERLGLKKNRAV
jgi:bifunctional non-homologous end joining protein LigD